MAVRGEEGRGGEEWRRERGWRKARGLCYSLRGGNAMAARRSRQNACRRGGGFPVGGAAALPRWRWLGGLRLGSIGTASTVLLRL